MHFSRQRKKILETLKNNMVHPSAECIHKILKQENSEIGLATVYRNLNKLADDGTIKKIAGLEDAVHYDHNTDLHYHFFCKRCRKIFDLPSNIAPSLVKKAEMMTGFKIDTHEIVFHGTCIECREDKGEENG